MICYEVDDDERDDVKKARLAVLEALTPMHLIRAYKDLDDLRAFLDAGLEDIRKALLADQVPPDTKVGLTRVWLFYKDPEAVNVVGVRMVPPPIQAGMWKDVGFERWPIPEGWFGFYRQIDDLRALARRYDPQIVFIHP